MNKKKASSGWSNRGGNFGGGNSSFRSRGGSRGGFRGRGRSGGGGGRKAPQIDITSFIQRARASYEQSLSEPVIEITVDRNFNDLHLHPQLLKNVQAQGFSQPTPIQDQVFDQVIAGQDVLGIANTGTGKTGAFLIPLVQQMMQDDSKKILVIAPTRELALQINDTFMELTKGARLFSVQAIGGTNMNRQMQNLRRSFNAVIGTPGRILDLADRQVLNLSEFNVVVLDEVDRMLDMGFVRDIRKILSSTPSNRQSLYFSATITNTVSGLIREFSGEVFQVSINANKATGLVEQDIVRYQHNEQKIELLHDILITDSANKVLIFGRTKHGVKKLMFDLRDRGFRTESLHGNKTQSQRQRALEDFRSNRVHILVATDVAARGLDVDDVSHVINFDVPESFDDYIHRIGRTGRGGKKGSALTFVK